MNRLLVFDCNAIIIFSVCVPLFTSVIVSHYSFRFLNVLMLCGSCGATALIFYILLCCSKQRNFSNNGSLFHFRSLKWVTLCCKKDKNFNNSFSVLGFGV
jgi:hypothetical protein